VKGMLIGTGERVHLNLYSSSVEGIGDAKGIPYENMKFEEILKLGPQIEIYAKCTNHLMQGNIYTKTCLTTAKDHPKGLWTDDTQLTLALCRALVEKSGFNMDAIAFQHVKAYEETVAG
jgi:ADP-ribosylglycohydrolase